jgi:hypothetical protein
MLKILPGYQVPFKPKSISSSPRAGVQPQRQKEDKWISNFGRKIT